MTSSPEVVCPVGTGHGPLTVADVTPCRSMKLVSESETARRPQPGTLIRGDWNFSGDRTGVNSALCKKRPDQSPFCIKHATDAGVAVFQSSAPA